MICAFSEKFAIIEILCEVLEWLDVSNLLWYLLRKQLEGVINAMYLYNPATTIPFAGTSNPGVIQKNITPLREPGI